MTDKKISVIIPVRNGTATIAGCVAGVLESGGGSVEVIVVNDHSTDNTAELAAEAGAKVLTLEGSKGVSAARNFGAENASGEILIFTDADVVFHAETITRLAECFSGENIHGAVGLFSQKIPSRGFAGNYKNLWMRYTYERLRGSISLFFTSIAAVRAEAFRAAGRFDERYTRPSVEDTDMGRRLADAGFNVVMCPAAEVTHGKDYTMAEVLGTDFRRASALVKLYLREKTTSSNKASAQKTHSKRFSVPVLYPIGALAMTLAVFTMLMIVGFYVVYMPLISGIRLMFSLSKENNLGRMLLDATSVISWDELRIPLVFTAAMIVVALLSNAGFLAYLLKRRGLFFLFPSLILWALDCVVATAGAACGMIGFLFGRKY